MRDDDVGLTDGQIRKRILRMVVNDCGPARRNTLVGFAENLGAKNGEELVSGMIASGQLTQFGKKRGTRWGVKRSGR